MKNKLKFVSVAAVVAGVLGGYTSAFAQQSGQQLTGDPKLACEAILCLSSGTRPGECGPSLSRYFGISYKSWSDTVKGRRNFLNQCPTSTHQEFNNCELSTRRCKMQCCSFICIIIIHKVICSRLLF